MALHEHKYEGQTLRHDHDGGSVPHGYFGHAEDYPGQPAGEGEYRNLSDEPEDNCEGQDAAEDECTARSRCAHQSGHGTGRWAHCAIPGCSNYLNICPVHEGTP